MGANVGTRKRTVRVDREYLEAVRLFVSEIPVLMKMMTDSVDKLITDMIEQGTK